MHNINNCYAFRELTFGHKIAAFFVPDNFLYLEICFLKLRQVNMSLFCFWLGAMYLFLPFTFFFIYFYLYS